MTWNSRWPMLISHDMGITSSFMPDNPYNYLDQTAPTSAGTPEVDNTTFNSVVFLCAVPANT